MLSLDFSSSLCSQGSPREELADIFGSQLYAAQGTGHAPGTQQQQQGLSTSEQPRRQEDGAQLAATAKHARHPVLVLELLLQEAACNSSSGRPNAMVRGSESSTPLQGQDSLALDPPREALVEAMASLQRRLVATAREVPRLLLDRTLRVRPWGGGLPIGCWLPWILGTHCGLQFPLVQSCPF
jgi:hypothetical protein